jgi:SAM-dependent methyltransferase
MTEQSKANRNAWEDHAYEWWLQYNGPPAEAAASIVADPALRLRKFSAALGDLKGKRVLNLLGSNARKAVPMCLLGADVTVVDISESNARYARELADASGVSLSYEVADFLEWQPRPRTPKFDIAFFEGGILHYFDDLHVLFTKIHDCLSPSGRLVASDFHPFRKCLDADILPSLDYFDSDLHVGPVAYASQITGVDTSSLQNCLLRYWTLGEIVTAVAGSDFRIVGMNEIPKPSNPSVPGEFVIEAVAV